MQVYFEGICISQTTADRAKVYSKTPLILVNFGGVIELKVFSKTNI